MARPLREGSLGEPPAPLPAHPACRGGGGALALPAHPACRGERGGALVLRGDPPPLTPPPRRHPRLSCACPGAPPPNFVLYRCGTRGTPGAAHGEFHPTEDGDHEGPPQSGGSQGGAVPNGHLPRGALGLEQELGARLRRLGDAFQQTYEQQVRGGHPKIWGGSPRDAFGGGAPQKPASPPPPPITGVIPYDFCSLWGWWLLFGGEHPLNRGGGHPQIWGAPQGCFWRGAHQNITSPLFPVLFPLLFAHCREGGGLLIWGGTPKLGNPPKKGTIGLFAHVHASQPLTHNL